MSESMRLMWPTLKRKRAPIFTGAHMILSYRAAALFGALAWLHRDVIIIQVVIRALDVEHRAGFSEIERKDRAVRLPEFMWPGTMLLDERGDRRRGLFGNVLENALGCLDLAIRGEYGGFQRELLTFQLLGLLFFGHCVSFGACYVARSNLAEAIRVEQDIFTRRFFLTPDHSRDHRAHIRKLFFNPGIYFDLRC